MTTVFIFDSRTGLYDRIVWDCNLTDEDIRQLEEWYDTNVGEVTIKVVEQPTVGIAFSHLKP